MTGQSLVTNGYICEDRVRIVAGETVILYGKMEGIMISHFVGEIGKVLIVDTSVDVSTASTTDIMVKKPDNTIHTWGASVYIIEGVANYLKYTIDVDDFDQPGLYEIQSKVIINGATLMGKTDRFEVLELFT